MMHVDTRDTRPDGRDRAEDEALSDRSHQRRMGADHPAVAEAGEARARAGGGLARGSERDPLHDPLGRRLADAAEGLPALADGLGAIPFILSPVDQYIGHQIALIENMLSP